jgi:hypothetical protein
MELVLFSHCCHSSAHINYVSVCVQKVVHFLELFKNVLTIDTFNYGDYSEDGFRPEI